MLPEVGMLREVVILAMFENEYPVFLQYTFLEDKVRDGWKFLKGVWRVGKDEVELLLTGLNKLKHIASERCGCLSSEFLKTLLDETVMVSIHLHANHSAASSGKKLQGDAASAGEKVEGCGFFEIYILVKNIEDVLFGKVGSRPRLESAWNVEMSALVYSCNDAHGVICPW